MTIKKGDSIQIIAGKDRGKTGKVLRVMRSEGRVIVEGLNIVKKHVRPRKQGEKGEIVEVPRPLDISNVQVLCGRCERPVRTKVNFDNNTKTRVCARCGHGI